MKAIETLQSTLNNWSSRDWSKESMENIKNEEPVMMDRQSPRVLKARGPRIQQDPRAKKSLKSLSTTKGVPASKLEPIHSPQNEIKKQSECAQTN